MIRIAFLIRSVDYGGAERHLLTLARFLDKKRFHVTVLYFYPGGRLETALRESNVRLVCLDKKGRWDVAGFLWRLFKQLRALRPSVLHSLLVEPNLLSVLLRPILPGTRIIWGVRASIIRFEDYDWLARLNFRLQSVLSRFSDRIIFNSEAGRAYHQAEGFPARKAQVIHNGIDTQLFKPERAAGRLLCAEMGIPDKAIVIGHVARFDPVKDHDTLLRAAAIVCGELPHVRFLIVGDGPKEYAARLQALAARLGISERVIWAGARARMTDVYGAFDVFASSSVSEGFPNVIGEAMACGVPCVVTDAGDSALIVGETGIVVAPQDPTALARALILCAERDLAELGARARERIVENFSVERMLRETERAMLGGAEGRGTDVTSPGQ
jgi:glycosyltransferase involved in cell wall biosynthesis